MKPSREEVLKAVARMSVVVPFFPKIELALDIIADCVRSMVANSEQLEWFTKKVCVTMKTWDDGGIPVLRAIFCTQYAPDDGEAPVVEVPGMTEADLEMRFRAMEMQENDRRFQEYQRLALAVPIEDLPLLAPPSEVYRALAQGAKMDPPDCQAYDAAYDTSPMGKPPILCPWCADGNPRVRSSVSGSLVHTNTEAGRVVCKNRNPDPAPVGFDAPQTPPVDADASRTLDGGSAS
jgi:hypothetical protein